jgi:hypothetical protein
MLHLRKIASAECSSHPRGVFKWEIGLNAYFSAFDLARNRNADISAFMNPAQLLRSIACCSASLVVTLIASCSSMNSKTPPPLNPMMTFSDGAGPITAGNRSGGYAINNKSIDNLLTPGSSTPIKDRPGLGTSAGREQYSVLESARMLRKSDTPDAVDSFHYNDEVGAKAMAGILGGSMSKRSGLFAAAGERLKVGLVRYGNVFPHYEVNGKRIVIGENGSHYEVRLENRTKKRIEVVLSVDGLNVLTGKSASPRQRGFVLDPKEMYDVDGFRKDSTTARSFVLGSVASSKAAAKGAAGNVGVIGLAVFEEDEARAKAELRREQLARENANAFPGAR